MDKASAFGGLATVADDEDDDMDDAASSTEVSSPQDRASRQESPVLGENSASLDHHEELDTRKQAPSQFFRSDMKTELDENDDSDTSGFANDLIQVSSVYVCLTVMCTFTQTHWQTRKNTELGSPLTVSKSRKHPNVIKIDADSEFEQMAIVSVITDMIEMRLPLVDRSVISQVLKSEYVNLAINGFIAGRTKIA